MMLNEAIAARDAAQLRLARAKESTALAKLAVEAAEAEIAKFDDDRTRWVERQASRIVDRARQFNRPPPALVATDDALLRLEGAKANLEAAKKALAQLQADELATQAVLMTAERDERQVRLELKRAKVGKIVLELRELYKRENFLSAQLLDVDMYDRDALTPEAFHLLADPPGRPTATALMAGHVLQDINTPISGNAVTQQARASWEEFDKQSGNVPETQDAAA